MSNAPLTTRLAKIVASTSLILSLSAPTQAFANWATLTPLENGRFDITALQYKDNIFVFNGFTTGIDIMPNIEKFDAETFDWSVVKETTVASGSAVTHNGLIRDGNEAWMIGGRIGDNPGAVSDLVWKYNLDTGALSAGPTMPNPVGGGGAALVDNKIHFFGGFDENASCDVYNHFVYDLSNPNAGWKDITSVAPVPVPRNHFATTVLNGEIYMIGGQFGHGGCADYSLNGVDTDLVHAYNPDTQVWTKKADLPTEQSHMEAGTFVYGGAIYAVGGQSARDSIFRYNPESDSWDTLELPELLHGPVSRVIGNNLLVAGGGGGTNGSTPLAETYFTDIRSLLLPSSSGVSYTLKSASATASQQSANTAQAFDEDLSTRWTTGAVQTPGQWFQLDLGKAQLVGHVVLNSSQSQNDQPASYRLETSVDGSNYTAAATGSGSADGVTEITFDSRSARYIKITQTGSKPNNWWSIQEISVSEGDVEALSRDNWVLTASQQSAKAALAIDDDSTTRWTTSQVQSATQWLQLDLSQGETFNRIELNSEKSAFDYPRYYTVKVSNNATNWTTVAEGNGSGPDTSISFSQQTARYVRIEQSGTDARSWWSVYEVNLFAGSAEISSSTVTLVANPDSVNATAGEAITIAPLANDTGNNLSLNAPSAWSLKGGSVALSGNTLRYTAKASYSGEDKIWYTVVDSAGQTTWSEITITVTGSGDADNGPPVANSDNVEATAGESITISPLANDTGNSLSLNAPSAWSLKGGTVAMSGNTLKYTANSSYSGEDKIWYTLVDSQGRTSWSVINITVAASNTGVDNGPPVTNPDSVSAKSGVSTTISPLANDTGNSLSLNVPSAWSLKGGTVALSGNKLTYKSNSSFTGEDKIWYTIVDSEGRTNWGEITITVTP